MMTLPEFKAWVDGLHSAAPSMSPQLLNQRIQDKLRTECAQQPSPIGSQLTRGWVNRSDRVPDEPQSYIMGPWGPEQPM